MNSGRSNNLVAKPAAEIFRSLDVDATAQHRCEFPLHRRQPEKSGSAIGIELHQNIHVALPPKSAGQHRTEQRKLPDMIPSAEIRECFARDGDR